MIRFVLDSMDWASCVFLLLRRSLASSLERRLASRYIQVPSMYRAVARSDFEMEIWKSWILGGIGRGGIQG